MPSSALRSWLAAAVLAALPCASKAGHLPYTGLNISGGEYGSAEGRPETDFTLPDGTDIAFAAAHEFTTIRVPFLWERLQPKLDTPLEGAELARLQAVVALARAKHLHTVLDVHNYARYRGEPIGSPQVSIEAFGRFWGRLALAFRDEPSVLFGLMNEPHDMPTETWASAAQAAVTAIRAAGTTQLILVPGNGYTGAHSWTTGGYGLANAIGMRGVTDPCDGLVFEFHQYLDADSSGTAATCRDPKVVAGLLGDATAWLRLTHHKGFLAEFGSGPDANCLAGLTATLQQMEAGDDVWIGWTYWAAGRWWPPTYPLSVQPAGGTDRLQMAVLQRAIGPRPPIAARICPQPAGARAGTGSRPASTRP